MASPEDNREEIGRDAPGDIAPRLTPPQKWLVAVLIVSFVACSILADLYPVKNCYFYVYSRVDGLLTMELRVNPAMRYTSGNGIHSTESLVYVLAVKLFYLLIPYRFACLRAVSVCSTVIALFFLFKLAMILFCRQVAFLFLFLLVTSPIYLESMRAIGFIPFTNTIVIIAAYFFVLSLRNKRWAIKVALSALFGLLTLSLYLPGKLIIGVLVVFALLCVRRYWRQLLLYSVIIIALIVVVDQVLGDISFDLKYALEADGEFLMYSPPLSRLAERLTDNTEMVAGYLLQLGRRPFTEQFSGFLEDCRSRLFNLAYTPFFFLGLAICLWRRRPATIFLLLWFGFFFLGPILSTELSPRRFILALNPIYLLVAVGLWLSYRLISRRIATPRGLKRFTCCSLVFLAGVGGIDLYEFFFQVAKPEYSYSGKQLKEIAEIINSQGRKADFILIDEIPMRDLIWGNPYYDKQYIDPDISNRFIYPSLLQNTATKMPLGEGGILFLYPFPSSRDRYSARDFEVIADLKSKEGVLNKVAEVKTAAGDNFFTFLINDESEVSPYIKKLLISEWEWGSSLDIPLRVSSEYSTVAGGTRLMDDRPITFWRISNVEFGKPAWIIRDFGKGKSRIIKTLKVLPRQDHPDEFFRNAELFGSNDGQNWEAITPIVQALLPSSVDWQEWKFVNDRSYRFYKLMIYDGYTGKGEYFLSLGELRLGK